MKFYSKQFLIILCFSILLVSCQQHYLLVAPPQFTAQEVAAARKVDSMRVASVIDRRAEKNSWLLGNFFDAEKNNNTIAYTSSPIEDIIASSINKLISKDSSFDGFKPFNIYIDNYQLGGSSNNAYWDYDLTFVFTSDSGKLTSFKVKDFIENQSARGNLKLDSLFKKSIWDAANSFSKKYTLYKNNISDTISSSVAVEDLMKKSQIKSGTGMNSRSGCGISLAFGTLGIEYLMLEHYAGTNFEQGLGLGVTIVHPTESTTFTLASFSYHARYNLFDQYYGPFVGASFMCGLGGSSAGLGFGMTLAEYLGTDISHNVALWLGARQILSIEGDMENGLGIMITVTGDYK